LKSLTMRLKKLPLLRMRLRSSKPTADHRGCMMHRLL
jgi:hypothetical protein